MQGFIARKLTRKVTKAMALVMALLMALGAFPLAAFSASNNDTPVSYEDDIFFLKLDFAFNFFTVYNNTICAVIISEIIMATSNCNLRVDF